jgi:hypothetical protein
MGRREGKPRVNTRPDFMGSESYFHWSMTSSYTCTWKRTEVSIFRNNLQTVALNYAAVELRRSVRSLCCNLTSKLLSNLG